MEWNKVSHSAWPLRLAVLFVRLLSLGKTTEIAVSSDRSTWFNYKRSLLPQVLPFKTHVPEVTHRYFWGKNQRGANCEKQESVNRAFSQLAAEIELTILHKPDELRLVSMPDLCKLFVKTSMMNLVMTFHLTHIVLTIWSTDYWSILEIAWSSFEVQESDRPRTCHGTKCNKTCFDGTCSWNYSWWRERFCWWWHGRTWSSWWL